MILYLKNYFIFYFILLISGNLIAKWTMQIKELLKFDDMDKGFRVKASTLT